MSLIRAHNRWLHVVALCLATAGAATSASAQTAEAIVDIRGGVAFSPSYLGSDDYDLAPDAAIRFNYVRLPGGLAFGSVDGIGLPSGPNVLLSTRYVGSRRPGDDPSLQGTDRVDQSVEVGLGLGYAAEDWRAFGVVRYGILGHNAWVGEAGADALVQPADGLVINLGPRAQFGSDRFMQTYFGVTAEEAEAGPLEEFSPGSGLYSVGVELGARYAFSERWGVEGAARYDRLVDDAADSPITQSGSRDQFGIRLGITRTIRLGF